jgi:hypothetical protein
MNAVKPVPLDTPVGPRNLRWTAGASRRINDKIGSIADLDDGEASKLAEACWYLMFDEQGKAPEGLSLDYWLNTCPLDPESFKELAAALGAAMSGKDPKDVRVLVETEAQRQTGSDTMPSPADVSASPESSSGGDTRSMNSTPSPKSGEKSAT